MCVRHKVKFAIRLLATRETVYCLRGLLAMLQRRLRQTLLLLQHAAAAAAATSRKRSHCSNHLSQADNSLTIGELQHALVDMPQSVYLMKRLEAPHLILQQPPHHGFHLQQTLNDRMQR